jgi:hypothetical protein
MVLPGRFGGERSPTPLRERRGVRAVLAVPFSF